MLDSYSTFTSSKSFFSQAYSLPSVNEWLPDPITPLSSKRSLLNWVHVEELLELDVRRLLQEEDQDNVDEVERLRVIDRMSLLEFSAPKIIDELIVELEYDGNQ